MSAVRRWTWPIVTPGSIGLGAFCHGTIEPWRCWSSDALGHGGDRADQHLGRRAGEHAAAVVLGDPVAVVAEAVGGAREVERVAQGVRAGGSLRDRGLVEHAQAHAIQDGRMGA